MFAYSDFASSVTRRLGSSISFTFLNSRENLLCLWRIRVFPQLYVKCGNRDILKYLRYGSSLSLLLSHQGYLLFVFLVVSKISVFLGHFFSGSQRLFHLFIFVFWVFLLISCLILLGLLCILYILLHFPFLNQHEIFFIFLIKLKQKKTNRKRCALQQSRWIALPYLHLKESSLTFVMEFFLTKIVTFWLYFHKKKSSS